MNIAKNFIKNNTAETSKAPKRSAKTTGIDQQPPNKTPRVEVINIQTLSCTPPTLQVNSDILTPSNSPTVQTFDNSFDTYNPSVFSQDLFKVPSSPSNFINVDN